MPPHICISNSKFYQNIPSYSRGIAIKFVALVPLAVFLERDMLLRVTWLADSFEQ